jgi:hypothetical protein
MDLRDLATEGAFDRCDGLVGFDLHHHLAGLDHVAFRDRDLGDVGLADPFGDFRQLELFRHHAIPSSAR